MVTLELNLGIKPFFLFLNIYFSLNEIMMIHKKDSRVDCPLNCSRMNYLIESSNCWRGKH